MSPPPSSGIIAGHPHQLAQAVGARLGVVKRGGQRVARDAQPLNAFAPCRRGGRQREIRSTGGKPLDFLQLDAVPRRVADDGVEAAPRLDVLPVLPNAGKRYLPVQEAFAVGNGAGGAPQFGKFRPGGGIRRIFHAVRSTSQQAVGIVPQGGHQLTFRAVFLPRLHACRHPSPATQKIKQAAQVGSRLLHPCEQRRRFAHLGHVGVGHRLDALHPRGGRLSAGDGGTGKQAAQPVQLARGILHPHPDERVANAQVVVQKGQRRAHREAVQPQRHLGQFHGQAVLVHPIDAALEHHAANDGLIRQLGFVDDPVGRRGALQDVVPDAFDALHQRRGVGAVQPRRDYRHILDQFGDIVRQEVHCGDQEMAAAHCRVKNLEVQDSFGRVVFAELGVPFSLRSGVVLQGRGLVLEGLEPFFCQRLQGAVHDQIDEFLGV